jgi:hypothetical protein
LIDFNPEDNVMKKTSSANSVNNHFVGKEESVKKIYSKLLSTLRKFGEVSEDAKKTSIHLNRNSALAGVQVRKSHLVLTIKSDCELKSPRIHKSEQVSANRFHHEIKLMSPNDVDKELQSWLKTAYDMSG